MMNAGRRSRLAPLVALVVLAVAPAAAHAEGPPHWYSNGKLIKEGVSEPVATSGTLTFSKVLAAESEVTCNISDSETIVNPKGGAAGTDQLTALTFSGCFIPSGNFNAPFCGSGAPEVIAKGLPWATKLLAGGRDEIAGVDLELKCSNNSFSETLTGTLTPEVGASVLNFSTNTGTLTQVGYSGATTNVLGTDKLIGPAKDERITVTSGQPQGNAHWYSNGKLLGTEKVEQTISWGKLTFESSLGPITCKKSDGGNIWNPAGGGPGRDETVEFDLYECSSPTCPEPRVTASGLPWHSELQEFPVGSGAVADESTGVELTLTCGELRRTFTGSVNPRVQNRSGTAEPTFEEFTPPSTHLTSKEGEALTITGQDFMRGWEKGDEVITAETAREFPGIGRCVKVPAGTGHFKTATCATAEVPNGNYEWYGGAVKNHFISTSGESTFETGGGFVVVSCTSDTDTGLYNGESEDRETITFSGCKNVNSGIPCTTGSLSSGTIQTSELRSLYGFIKRPTTAGVDLEAVSGPFMEFSCGTTTVTARGSLIGQTTPVNKMSSTFTETFAGAKNRQNIQKFEGEPPDFPEASVNGGPYESAQLTSTDVVTNEEPLEVRLTP